MDKLKEAAAQSYMDYCTQQYFAGWDAQSEGIEIPHNATEMYRDGWADSYAADQIINERVRYE